MAKKGKAGRSKRKRERIGSPISLFVRGKITAGKYWEMTGQSLKMPRD
jgi:hypothetical protein